MAKYPTYGRGETSDLVIQQIMVARNNPRDMSLAAHLILPNGYAKETGSIHVDDDP
jgi:hypothetical protein